MRITIQNKQYQFYVGKRNTNKNEQYQFYVANLKFRENYKAYDQIKFAILQLNTENIYRRINSPNTNLL